MRPIVEKLLRRLVLAGLPLVAACDNARALGGDAGAGTGGAFGSGGSGGSGGATGGGGSGGATGSGGAGGVGVACEPFSVTCGTRYGCAGAPGLQPLTTATVDFAPGDERWVDL